MNNQRMVWTISAAFLFVACDERREPFGKLPRSKIAEWADECTTPIVDEPVIKGNELTAAGKVFPATHRFVCKPPGWAVYIDGSDRIVGLCVDDKMTQPIEDYFQRARRVIGKRVRPELGADITQGVCSFVPETVAHGLLRWHQDVRPVVKPDGTLGSPGRVGTHGSCCWAVKD